MKNLGDLHYCLGFEVLPITSDLLFTQHKYILGLLECTNMVGAKEWVTPLSTSQHLCINDGSPLTHAHKVHQVIDPLQYLALTRPDISYVVNKLAQFMHCPSKNHLSSAKHVLRYLKSTIHHGLFLMQC